MSVASSVTGAVVVIILVNLVQKIFDKRPEAGLSIRGPASVVSRLDSSACFDRFDGDSSQGVNLVLVRVIDLDPQSAACTMRRKNTDVSIQTTLEGTRPFLIPRSFTQVGQSPVLLAVQAAPSGEMLKRQYDTHHEPLIVANELSRRLYKRAAGEDILPCCCIIENVRHLFDYGQCAAPSVTSTEELVKIL